MNDLCRLYNRPGQKTEKKMDFDEPMHGKPSGATSLATEALEDLSIFELEERISILEAEIVRTKDAIKAKEAGQSAADSVFR